MRTLDCFAALAMTVKATGYVLGVVGARERSLTRRSGVQQSFFARVLENAACEIRGLVPGATRTCISIRLIARADERSHAASDHCAG
jgi:hypothetical protein